MAKTFARLLLILATASGSTFAQQKAQQQERAVLVPQEVALKVIVAQPDCPLIFERVYVLKYLDGRFDASYQLRNIGNKPISTYTVAIWNSDNTGDLIKWHVNEEEGLLMPGQSAPSLRQDSGITIVPLSKELQNSLDLHSPMKGVVFFMIVEVEFSDGTRYDAHNVFETLKEHLKYFEGIYEKKIGKLPLLGSSHKFH